MIRWSLADDATFIGKQTEMSMSDDCIIAIHRRNI